MPGAVDVGLSTQGSRSRSCRSIWTAASRPARLSRRRCRAGDAPGVRGVDAGDWVDPDGETRNVMVRLHRRSRRGASEPRAAAAHHQRAAAAVQPVPLDQIAQITTAWARRRSSISTATRMITVPANVEGRPLRRCHEAIDQRLATIIFPPAIAITQGGEAADQEEVFGRIFIALGIAVLLMYLVLVMQFGSFIDPFAVMLSLPLSLIGVVLALLVTGDTLNLMSLIGVIMLMGIVAKNAILLLDCAKEEAGRALARR